MTTSTPFNASTRPSPVITSTPCEREIPTTSWPCSRRHHVPPHSSSRSRDRDLDLLRHDRSFLSSALCPKDERAGARWTLLEGNEVDRDPPRVAGAEPAVDLLDR